jgi:type II secretory pathway pseudopilin PulG
MVVVVVVVVLLLLLLLVMLLLLRRRRRRHSARPCASSLRSASLSRRQGLPLRHRRGLLAGRRLARRLRQRLRVQGRDNKSGGKFDTSTGVWKQLEFKPFDSAAPRVRRPAFKLAGSVMTS